jgi:hypothetical protein
MGEDERAMRKRERQVRERDNKRDRDKKRKRDNKGRRGNKR